MLGKGLLENTTERGLGQSLVVPFYLVFFYFSVVFERGEHKLLLPVELFSYVFSFLLLMQVSVYNVLLIGGVVQSWTGEFEVI